MRKFKTLDYSNVYGVGEIMVVRCVEKEVDLDGNLVGHPHVWYDVNLDHGNGDTIESFKTLTKAKEFVRNWLWNA